MKTLLSKLTLIALCIATIVGCQTDPTTEVADGKYLTVSIEKTRTSLGEKVGKTYPVYWSADDQVVVNGEVSGKAQIGGDNKSVASFSLSDNAEYPYSVTYPYCTSTTATAPMVEFPAEQSYVKGSYDIGCAPMCGYAEEGQSVALKHLATILRFPIKAVAENTTLDRVVVTSSTAKLAGEFAVDCQNGTIEATAETTNSVTYTVNQALSTTEEIVLHISLPAVNAGTCKLEFIDSKGGKMNGSWSAGTLNAGVVKEFKCVEFAVGTHCTLTNLENEDDFLIFDGDIYGYVRDNQGNPIKDVAVSDGFAITTTDEYGYYKISNVSASSYYIYITIPAEYEIPINEYGQPCFYQKYVEEKIRYDFTLTPLAGGKEEKFALFILGDPQVDNNTEVNLFRNDAVPGIRKHCKEVTNAGIPCYAVTLGDILSSNASDNDAAKREPMRDAFACSNIGLPVFQILGNHDYTYYKEEVVLDEKNPNINLAAQRAHEEVFGPINYSFDRGNFHIIGMKNIYYTKLEANGVNDYGYGFTDEEFEWLKQDLALVPKDKAVVLCVHGRILRYTPRHYSEAKNLLNKFNEVHIMTGHTHKTYNYEHDVYGSSTPKIYEHNAGALCGAWWSSRICGDGVPNGYQVFIGGNDENGGGKFVDWYFMGFYEGMNTRDHQMRLYRGDAVTGIEKSLSNKPDSDITGYYGFNFGEDILLANVYNADSKWVIKVYEDDVHTGNMELIPMVEPAFTSLIGDWTYASPRRFESGVATSQDMYVVGLFAGVLGLGDSNGPDNCWNDYRNHFFKYKLTNPNNKENIEDIAIKVVAIDRFGTEYTETKITEGTDYSLTKNP